MPCLKHLHFDPLREIVQKDYDVSVPTRGQWHLQNVDTNSLKGTSHVDWHQRWSRPPSPTPVQGTCETTLAVLVNRGIHAPPPIPACELLIQALHSKVLLQRR